LSEGRAALPDSVPHAVDLHGFVRTLPASPRDVVEVECTPELRQRISKNPDSSLTGGLDEEGAQGPDGGVQACGPLERMAPGVNISALALELGICRQRLYDWQAAMRAGDEQLRRPGRPRRGPPRPPRRSDPGQQVAELERKIGQRELELDFFKEALRRVEGLRRPSNGPGATASTPSSKR
jgi:transposase-like protein